MNGWAFVFRNRMATAVKILLYDGQGFWLCQKRLSRGRFGHWPATAKQRRASCRGMSCTCCFLAAIPKLRWRSLWRPVMLT